MSASKNPAVRAVAAKENTTASSNRTLQLSPMKALELTFNRVRLGAKFLASYRPIRRTQFVPECGLPLLITEYNWMVTKHLSCDRLIASQQNRPKPTQVQTSKRAPTEAKRAVVRT